MIQKNTSPFAFAGLLLVFIISSAYFFVAITSMLNIAISKWHLPLAVVAGAALAVYFFRRYYAAIAIGGALAVGAMAVSFFIGSNTLDISWDGMWYHQAAVIAIAEDGVNLYHTQYLFERETGFYINHYPACSWFIQAVIFKFSGNLECAKLLTPLWVFASFFLLFYLLRSLIGVSTVVAVVASILVAFNPVALNQYYSFYIDGQIAAQLTCLLALLGIYFYTGGKRYLLATGFMVVLLLNMKFTSVVYACMFIAFFSVVLLAAQKISQLVRFVCVSVLALFLGFFVFGAHPYARNVKDGGHVFYPLMGDKKVDIMNQGFGPQYMVGRNRLKKFAKSMLSFTARTQDARYIAKGPFVYKPREYYATVGINWIIGGMGPFFSGIMLLGIVLLVLSFRTGTHRRFAWTCLFIGVAVLLTVIINPENWYSRYVPQLWLVPFLFALPAIKTHSSLFSKLLLLAMFLYAAVNCGMFISSSVLIHQKEEVSKVLASIRKMNKQHAHVVVHTGYFDKSFRQWLKRENIQHWKIDTTRREVPCASFVPVIHSIKLCPE